jgi:hypothetical protein
MRTIKFSTNTPVPALLRACRTSRETILKVYTTCLESGSKKIRMDGDNDVLVLFNTVSTCAGFAYYNAFPWLQRRTMHPSHIAMFSGVKNLAVPINTFIHRSFKFRYWEAQQWLISQFQSLKRYLILMQSSSNNLDRQEDGIYFMLPADYLPKFGKATIPDWATEVSYSLRTEIQLLSKHALSAIVPDPNVDIVPVYVRSSL